MTRGENWVAKYNFVSSENFEEYMKAVGVGFALRKIANQQKPVLEIKIEGDTWTITSVSTFKTTVLSFKLGEPFEETTADGRKLKTTFTLEGEGDNTLVQAQKGIKEGDKDSTITRILHSDGKMEIKCVCGDVVSTRFYQRA